jgi:putative redox protein
MKATAHRTNNGYIHKVVIRQHSVTIDEPTDQGGDDAGPTPQELLAASLASCTAVTMEMYAKHKGWDLGVVEVQVEYTTAERGSPTRFELVLRLPSDSTEEQIQRLQAIAAKCPVHRTLEGEVVFEDRIELIEPAAH